MEFSNLNFLAVIVAALASWAIGAIWYSPVMFGKVWQRELGYSEEYLKESNMAVVFGLSFVLMFVAVLGLAFLIQGQNEEDMCWSGGLLHGALVGLAFGATSIGINYLYQRKSLTLWLIDALYYIVFLSVAGIILAVW